MQPALTHLALHVRDLDACVAFYRRFCGLGVVHERGGGGKRVAWLAEHGRERLAEPGGVKQRRLGIGPGIHLVNDGVGRGAFGVPEARAVGHPVGLDGAAFDQGSELQVAVVHRLPLRLLSSNRRGDDHQAHD